MILLDIALSAKLYTPQKDTTAEIDVANNILEQRYIKEMPRRFYDEL